MNPANSNQNPNDSLAVAVLGLGPMGRAVASALLSSGLRTTAWNRSPGKADDLLERGLVIAESVSAAMQSADVVISCLRDYDALRSSLAKLAEANLAGAAPTLVNLSSGTPEEAESLAALAARLGISYLEGAILTPTPVMGTPGVVVLTSGPSAVFGNVRPILTRLGAPPLHMSEDIAVANRYDVALLDLFATCTLGLVHSLSLAAESGLSLPTFARLAAGIGGVLPEMVTRFAEQLSTREFPGHRSVIRSAEVSVRHARELSSRYSLDTGALDSLARSIDRALAEGHGDDGLARLATYMRSTAALAG